MTTTYYVSFNNTETMGDPANAGTSSTAGDIIELRMGNGTYVPSQRQIFNALEFMERWILQGGLDGAGANLPPDRG